MFAQPHFFQQSRAGCVHVFWGVRVTPSLPHTVVFDVYSYTQTVRRNCARRPAEARRRAGRPEAPRSPQRQEWGFGSARREPLNDPPASDVPAAFRWRDAAAVAAL